MIREQVAQHVRSLRGGVQTEALSIPLTERRARLHRVHDDAVVDDSLLYDMCGGFERRVGLRALAFLPMKADVTRGLRPDLCGAGGVRRGRFDDRGQIFVAHAHPLGGVARGAEVFGDDHGHRLTDVAHDAVGEQRPRWRHQRLAVTLFERDETGQGAEAGGANLCGGIDRKHPRYVARGADVERMYARVRMRRAQE